MKSFLQLLFFSLMLSSCSPFSDVNKDSDIAKYSQIVQEEEAIGLDVRSIKEFERNGSTSAVNIPIAQLSSRFDELDKKKTVLVFCESGGRSLVAKKLLQMKGFKKVINIKDWRTWDQVIEGKI